jgi:hypothetical protein
MLTFIPATLHPVTAYAGIGDSICPSNNLQVAVTNGPEGFAGNESYEFFIVNTSRKACSLLGFPTIKLFSDSKSTGLDSITPFRVMHSPSQIFAEPKPKRVLIDSGSVASFGLSFSDAAAVKHDSATYCSVSMIYVTLPTASDRGSTYSERVDFDICRASRTILLTPIESGPSPAVVSS